MSKCLCVCVSVCLSVCAIESQGSKGGPRGAKQSPIVFEASHWPSDRMTKSGLSLVNDGGGGGLKNPAYGRHQLSRPMRIIGPIQA